MLTIACSCAPSVGNRALPSSARLHAPCAHIRPQSTCLGACTHSDASAAARGYYRSRQNRADRVACPRRRIGRDSGRQAANSFLGVGAPEAVLVGVVALVVFGPKGLADAAKGVGKALKSFQPTIQELSQVSNDLKSTLQNEIGLDEFRRDIESIRNTPLMPPPPPVNLDTKAAAAAAAERPALAETSSSSQSQASSSAQEPFGASGAQSADLERMRAESAKMAWGGVPAELSGAGAAVEPAKPAKKALEEMSLVELEAEIAKRKALIADLAREA